MSTHKTSDHLSHLADQAEPLLNRASEQANELAQRVMEAVRESSQQLHDSTQRASDRTVKYVKNEPVKSLLIAAAAGAALMAIINLMSHPRGRR